MSFNLADTVALLERTPAALTVLLRDLRETWTHRTEGDGTFTVFDVIGHLIHSEHVNWIPRAQAILHGGEKATFAPFDRWTHRQQTHGKSLNQLLDEFAHARAQTLSQLEALHLQPQDLDKRGTHPSFGTVTLSQLLATWAAHDLTHLHQISRIMAHQYREAVGPWSAFLGVLKCAGHSE
jgi:hypothetical protein